MKNTLIILLVALIMGATNTFAQTKYVQKGKTFVQIKSKSNASKATKTDCVWVIDGKSYPIYISSKGKAFINKVSKISGKTYRYYLPNDVVAKINKKQNN